MQPRPRAALPRATGVATSDPVPPKKTTTTVRSRRKRISSRPVAPRVVPAKAIRAIPARTAKTMDSRTSCGHDHLLHQRLCITDELFSCLQRSLYVRLLGMMPREFYEVGFLQECAEQILVFLGQGIVLRNLVQKLLGRSLGRAQVETPFEVVADDVREPGVKLFHCRILLAQLLERANRQFIRCR